MNYLKYIFKNIILLTFYGLTYIGIEYLYRGYSHWTMMITGGLCGFFIGKINEYIPWKMPIWKQILYGEIIVLILEFVTGCIVNMYLNWNIWDYSSLPFNLYGQICLPFAILWIPLILVTIILDDYLRYWWFREERPRYYWQ